MSKRPAVLAVDGGGSKVDATIVDRSGSVRAAVRIVSTDHDGSHSLSYLEGVAAGVQAVATAAGLRPHTGSLASLGVYCLAGADLPADDRRLVRWLAKQRWTDSDLLRNDTFAVLRSGTDRTWGVGVVCGFGTNCSGIAPDGRVFRFPAIGRISGDWGGGMDVGEAALWYAMRARDGRGPSTTLARLVPEYLGVRTPRQVMEAIYFGRMRPERLVELPKIVFRAAAEGDAAAASIVDHQADEIIAMAGAAIRKLKMSKLDVHVVLGGGIFRNDHRPFFDRIEQGVRRVAPRVRITALKVPPVLGAALLGLDRLGASERAKMQVRDRLTHDGLSRMPLA